MPRTFIEKMEDEIREQTELNTVGHHQDCEWVRGKGCDCGWKEYEDKVVSISIQSVTEAVGRMVESVPEQEKGVIYSMQDSENHGYNQARQDLISAAKSMGIEVGE